MFHRIAIWRVFVTRGFSTFSTKSGRTGSGRYPAWLPLSADFGHSRRRRRSLRPNAIQTSTPVFLLQNRPSFLRHPGLPQPSEVSGFKQRLDLGNIISAGPHASDAWIRALTREIASLG